MNLVIFHGILEETYGREFKISASNPVEIMQAFMAQLDGFRDMIKSRNWKLIREVKDLSLELDIDTLFLGMNNVTLHFVPVVEGDASTKSKGIGKVILGIALVAVGLFTGNPYILLLGVGLALSGVALLLSPQILNNQEEDRSSYLFGGGINSTGQNFRVPIACGKIRVAGTPIATQITTNEYGASVGGVLYNPYDGTGGLGSSYGDAPGSARDYSHI